MKPASLSVQSTCPVPGRFLPFPGRRLVRPGFRPPARRQDPAVLPPPALCAPRRRLPPGSPLPERFRQSTVPYRYVTVLLGVETRRRRGQEQGMENDKWRMRNRTIVALSIFHLSFSIYHFPFVYPSTPARRVSHRNYLVAAMRLKTPWCCEAGFLRPWI